MASPGENPGRIGKLCGMVKIKLGGNSFRLGLYHHIPSNNHLHAENNQKETDESYILKLRIQPLVELNSSKIPFFIIRIFFTRFFYSGNINGIRFFLIRMYFINILEKYIVSDQLILLIYKNFECH